MHTKHTDERCNVLSDGVGLTLSSQESVSAVATVTIDETVTSVWNTLASSEAFQIELVRAALDAGRGRTYLEYHDVLKDAGIDAIDGSYRSLVVRTARGDCSAFTDLLRKTEQLGKGQSPIDDVLSAVQLFSVALENEPERDVPTFGFKIEYDSFTELRRDQRENICQLLSSLSRGFDVQVIASGPVRSYLRQNHRESLSNVSELNNTPREYGSLSEAFDRLSPDDRETGILRDLENEPTGTLTYRQIQSDSYVSDSRVRQCLSTLSGLGLIEAYHTSSEKKVELLEVGREYLAEVPRQSTLNDANFSTPNTHLQSRVDPNSGKGGRDSQLYRTTFQSRPNKEAAVASGLENDISIVKEPIELDQTTKERRTKPFSYDAERNEAVVSVRATGALDYTVSIATTLADPDFLNRTLPIERLDEIDEPDMILRQARNIGWFPAEAENNPRVLRENLIELGEELESLTTTFKNATGDDKKALASEIMRKSHGLAGVIISLLDAAGVDITREIRLASGLELNRLETVGESICRSILIQSKYGVFAPYRHLIETDAGKPTISPEIDAANPTGSLIGSFVIRGKDAYRIESIVERQLSSFEFLDEPAEFTIPVTIGEIDRRAFATVATRMLKTKNIRPTREAISVLHALTGSPYDAANVLNQLKKENERREVRPDELRYGLRTLEAEQLVPRLNPTAGKVVQTLIQATEPLSQTALADKAGVSTQSIRNNRDVLEALDLITVDESGWRLSLSFRTTEERRSPVTPEFVDSAFIDAVDALLTAVLPADRYGDPNDEIGKVLFWPPDPWGLLDNEQLSPWVELAAALTGTEKPETESTITVGPTVSQTPIQETGSKKRV